MNPLALMETTFPVPDAQQLYKQWQDGKLLDRAERRALRVGDTTDASQANFADLLKSASEHDR